MRSSTPRGRTRIVSRWPSRCEVAISTSRRKRPPRTTAAEAAWSAHGRDGNSAFERASRESELAGARAAREVLTVSSAPPSRRSRASPPPAVAGGARPARRVWRGAGGVAESNGDVGKMGSVADYLDVQVGYEPPSKRASATASARGGRSMMKPRGLKSPPIATPGEWDSWSPTASRRRRAPAIDVPASGQYCSCSDLRLRRRADCRQRRQRLDRRTADHARAAASAVDGPVAALNGMSSRPHQVEGGTRAEARAFSRRSARSRSSGSSGRGTRDGRAAA